MILIDTKHNLSYIYISIYIIYVFYFFGMYVHARTNFDVEGEVTGSLHNSSRLSVIGDGRDNWQATWPATNFSRSTEEVTDIE